MTAHEREALADRCARCDGTPDAQALLAEARAQVEEARRERDEARIANAKSCVQYAELVGRMSRTEATLADARLAAEQGVKVAEALATEKAALLSRVVVLEVALRGLRYPGEPERFCDHAAAPCDRCDAARAALEVEP